MFIQIFEVFGQFVDVMYFLVWYQVVFWFLVFLCEIQYGEEFVVEFGIVYLGEFFVDDLVGFLFLNGFVICFGCWDQVLGCVDESEFSYGLFFVGDCWEGKL